MLAHSPTQLWYAYPKDLPASVTIEETPERVVLWIELELNPYAEPD